MQTATKVQDVERNADTDFRKLGPPLALGEDTHDVGNWQRVPATEHVFVSSVVLNGEPETYAFACDAEGTVLSWLELPGSMKGEVTHADVLRATGYEVQP